MRVGIIVRANDKGLGTQTYNAWRNYGFTKALLVLDHKRNAPEFPDRYPGVPQVSFDANERRLVEWDVVEKFLDGLDALFSVETLYDARLAKTCAERGIRTVVQGNPEFYKRALTAGAPRNWIWPTTWLIDHLPGIVVPVPVSGLCTAEAAEVGDDLVIVHIAGHRAIGDRNGTDLFIESLRYLNRPMTIRLYCQDGDEPRIPRLNQHITLEHWPSGVADRWAMYDGAHALVMPRRYGGLCLPVHEAMEAGLAVLMPDGSPNPTMWPILPMRAGQGRLQRTPFGPIRTLYVPPRVIAKEVNRLYDDRERLATAMRNAREWAATHTWDSLRPAYDALWSLDEDPLPRDPQPLRAAS